MVLATRQNTKVKFAAFPSAQKSERIASVCALVPFNSVDIPVPATYVHWKIRKDTWTITFSVVYRR